MGKEALIIIDMLNDFVREGAALEVPATRNIIPNIARETERARSLGNPVIYVCDTHAPGDREFTKFGWPAHGVRGSEGDRVVRELEPREGDIIVEKTTYSSFFGTRLDDVLGALGIDSVRLTGCVTHICILFTAYEASLRDLKVAVVGDGIAGLEREDHDAALRIMKNVLGVTIV